MPEISLPAIPSSFEEVLDGLEYVADHFSSDPEDVSIEHPENPEEISQLIIDLGDALRKYNDASERFCNVYMNWRVTRQNSINQLNSLADGMDGHRRNTNIASLAGSSVGIVGGVMVIGGLIASPFTAGASLALTAWGTGLGVAGGLTSGGTSLADFLLKRKHAKEGKEVLEKDKDHTDEMRECFTHVSEASEVLEKACVQIHGTEMPVDRMKCIFSVALIAAKTPMTLVSSAKDSLRVYKCFQGMKLLKNTPATLLVSDIKSFGKGLAKMAEFSERAPTDVKSMTNLYQTLKGTGTIASKTARAFSGFLSAIGIALDVYNIVSVSKDLSNESRTELGARLRNAATELKEEEQIIEGVYKTIQENNKNLNVVQCQT